MSKLRMIDIEICCCCFCYCLDPDQKKYIKMIGLFVRNVNELPTMVIRRLINVRSLSLTNRTLEKSSSSSTPSSPPQTQPTESPSSSAQPWQKATSASRKLSNFDKRILVWSGKYKNVDEIPSTVA